MATVKTAKDKLNGRVVELEEEARRYKEAIEIHKQQRSPSEDEVRTNFLSTIFVNLQLSAGYGTCTLPTSPNDLLLFGWHQEDMQLVKKLIAIIPEVVPRKTCKGQKQWVNGLIRHKPRSFAWSIRVSLWPLLL